MTVAICDDDAKFCDALCQAVQTYLYNTKIDADVHIYLTGEDLCEAFAEAHFDLIFLDIELTDINGVGVGQMLRQSAQDVQIVYVSSKEEYAMQLFQNRPFDFLVKPVTQKRLNALLGEYFRVFPPEDRYFSYTADRQKAEIAVSRILYFESIRKQLRMVTADGDILIYGKLSDILSLRFSHRFLRIHQSYLVNMQHIAAFRYGEITLTNGGNLPISRSCQNAVREELMQRGQERIGRGSGI